MCAKAPWYSCNSCIKPWNLSFFLVLFRNIRTSSLSLDAVCNGLYSDSTLYSSKWIDETSWLTLMHTNLSEWGQLTSSISSCTDHVPGKVGQPVENRFDPADKLQVFSFADSLLDQKKDETGRHEGHGKDHTDGNQDIHRCSHPEGESREKHIRGLWTSLF